MQVFVKALDGKTTIADVPRAGGMVADLADAVWASEGIPQDDQRLLYRGNQMELGKTLAEYGVVEEATIHLTAGLHRTMVVFVRTQTGLTLTVEVPRAGARVDHLADAYTASEGVPQYQQRLIYGGQQMQLGKTLAEYGVAEGATIILVLRLPGC
ncbi:MAG: ubiquitin-related domain-containing protein [Monoraphidium minutum]|nr:MAG: ubiquitin-related domain-containing protein [Monoraphidium minutum]